MKEGRGYFALELERLDWEFGCASFAFRVN